MTFAVTPLVLTPFLPFRLQQWTGPNIMGGESRGPSAWWAWRQRRRLRRGPATNLGSTANLHTKILDVRGLDSSIIWIARGGIPRPIWNLQESLSQGILVGIISVGRLCVESRLYCSGATAIFLFNTLLLTTLHNFAILCNNMQRCAHQESDNVYKNNDNLCNTWTHWCSRQCTMYVSVGVAI